MIGRDFYLQLATAYLLVKWSVKQNNTILNTNTPSNHDCRVLWRKKQLVAPCYICLLNLFPVQLDLLQTASNLGAFDTRVASLLESSSKERLLLVEAS